MSEYFVYAVHRGDVPGANGISAVDPDTGEVAGTVSLGSVAPLSLADAGEGTLVVLVDDTVEARAFDTGRFAFTDALDLDANPGSKSTERIVYRPADSPLLFVAGLQKIVATQEGREPVTMRVPGYSVVEMAATADGASLYVRTTQTILRFDTATGELLARNGSWTYRSFAVHPDGSAVHPDGSAVYATAGELLLRLDGTTLAATVERKQTLRDSARLAVDPDGTCLYIASVTGGIPDMTQKLDPLTLEHAGTVETHTFAPGRRWAPDGRLATFEKDMLAVMEFTTGGRGTGARLPGQVVDIAFAGPPGRLATRLEATTGPLLVPVRIEGLSARLTTEEGTPVSGERLEFLSASGRRLATATTGHDGRAEPAVEALVPLDPATGIADTTTVTGPYTVTYTGRRAYTPAQTTTHTDPS